MHSIVWCSKPKFCACALSKPMTAQCNTMPDIRRLRAGVCPLSTNRPRKIILMHSLANRFHFMRTPYLTHKFSRFRHTLRCFFACITSSRTPADWSRCSITYFPFLLASTRRPLTPFCPCSRHRTIVPTMPLSGTKP